MIIIALEQRAERYERLPTCIFIRPAFHDARGMAQQAEPVCSACVMVAAASEAIEHCFRESMRACWAMRA